MARLDYTPQKIARQINIAPRERPSPGTIELSEFDEFRAAFQAIGIKTVECQNRPGPRLGRVLVDGRPLYGQTREIEYRLRKAGYRFSPGVVGFMLRLWACVKGGL